MMYDSWTEYARRLREHQSQLNKIQALPPSPEKTLLLQRLRANDPSQKIARFNVRPGLPLSNSPSRLSSSWVREVAYYPQTKMSAIRLKNRLYTYPMSRRRLQTLLTSRSIGRMINSL